MACLGRIDVQALWIIGHVSNFKMYLSQITKRICLKLQNVFVPNRKMYLLDGLSGAGL